ncbi:MAPEG family protein [Sphingomonas radiodurans]|nr:MAPEG family protein [Sphingomonas radiodurans]WBH18267.1 MAPEG family protein [Sphingomonas radiodurans]
MQLPVTLVIAAACGVINIWLALRLVRGRLKGKVLMGDGGDPAMEAGMRSHANFIEYAPIVLILMALIELARGPLLALWVIGALFVLSRIAHPLGMSRPAPNPFRAGGALITWAVTLLLAGWALAIAIESPRTMPTSIVPVEQGAPRA